MSVSITCPSSNDEVVAKARDIAARIGADFVTNHEDELVQQILLIVVDLDGKFLGEFDTDAVIRDAYQRLVNGETKILHFVAGGHGGYTENPLCESVGVFRPNFLNMIEKEIRNHPFMIESLNIREDNTPLL